MSVLSTAKLVIPSQVRLVDLVHCSAERMAEVAGFSEDEALDVGLAVREAAINAIRHGNKEQPGTHVQVVLEVDSGGLRVEIRDQGAGFDPDSEPDPTAGDNLLKTSGRGLLLIRAFVDEVTYRYEEGRGMVVTLSKKRERAGRLPAGDGEAQTEPGKENER